MIEKNTIEVDNNFFETKCVVAIFAINKDNIQKLFVFRENIIPDFVLNEEVLKTIFPDLKSKNDNLILQKIYIARNNDQLVELNNMK